MRFRLYTLRQPQLSTAGSAAGKAWWREETEAPLRQAHDTHKQHLDGGNIECGKPQVITRASKHNGDERGRE
jgi:hypothetical protein